VIIVLKKNMGKNINKKMMRSNAEDAIIEFWNELEKRDFISVKELMIFGDKLSKLMMKCEELRKSRDKWSNKYTELKNGKKK